MRINRLLNASSRSLWRASLGLAVFSVTSAVAQTPYYVNQPSVFVPLTGCRLVDTRSDTLTGADKFPASSSRSFLVWDDALDPTDLSAQGGPAGGCGVSECATAIHASISVAAIPSSSGYARIWNAGDPEPSATVLNWTAGVQTTNTANIPICSRATNEAGPGACVNNGGDITFRNYGGDTHFVIDITGYYVNPADESGGPGFDTCSPP